MSGPDLINIAVDGGQLVMLLGIFFRLGTVGATQAAHHSRLTALEGRI